MRPRAILVTGAPGSGKSTLARRLAEVLRVPYLARDDVRGGLLFSAGAWTESLERVPPSEEAVEVFLAAVEGLLAQGVSCVVEYVVRAHRPDDLERILAGGDTVVLMTSCRDPMARFVQGNDQDRLIANQAVLDAIGLDSVATHTAAAVERMRQVVSEMRTTFPVPLLSVDTTDGYDPALDAIVDFVTG